MHVGLLALDVPFGVEAKFSLLPGGVGGTLGAGPLRITRTSTSRVLVAGETLEITRTSRVLVAGETLKITRTSRSRDARDYAHKSRTSRRRDAKDDAY